ncbi:nickel-dependent lactate racemase [Caproiciproducens sp. CPB-2]|uniref:nickel-dependent lactate racemase n=1 Tax=Caproiciproducens sp. CPB-2 TaxID=3030017 RepID=UPI0023DCBF45|nr:nickel-dependent lactate racemase [Caproiciproducens sp. CPB-2]MDF1495357.1 nickel-dependent lactate racemase [Caproiciproducens sp. CPB-2]
MSIMIPFGKSGMPLHADLSDAEILESHVEELKAADTEDGLVLAAMANPIDSPRLRELAAGKKTCTIIISDHTRPVPSKHILPAMLAELREGSPDIDVTLLVATGFHRPTGKEELVAKLGRDIVEREKIVIHDSRDASGNVQIGVLPSGAACVIDKIAAQTDLLVAEGFIEPHFFAGFSGGRKSVLPGVCDQVTVLGNHCSEFIASPYARTGVLNGNPLHKDMLAAAKMAHLAYIVNVIIDEDKHVVAAFAGDAVTAHRRGCDLLLKYCQVQPEKRGDIVISSNGGYPLDQNIYQSVKGLTAAEAAAAPDAVLIMVSSCSDGHGGESFYRALRDCVSPEKLAEQILATPQDRTRPDQWEFQILCRVLCKHHVIYVTEPEQRKTIEDMKIAWAPDVDTALKEARDIKGADAHLVVIPNGISVMVRESA